MWTRLPAHIADSLEPAKRNSKLQSQSKILSIEFLRKYIQYCKSCPAPILTDEAVELIADFYAEIRRRLSKETTAKINRANHAKAIPTPRLLEACVRLATAHAKLKLSSSVEEDDVAEAKKLLYYTMCGIEPNQGGDNNDEERSPPIEDLNTPAAHGRRSETSKRRRQTDASEEQSVTSAMKDLSIGQRRKQRKTATIGSGPSVSRPTSAALVFDDVNVAVSDERKNALKSIFEELQAKYDSLEWEAEKLMEAANKKMLKLKNRVFEETEFKAIVRKLQVENHLMIVESRIYFV
eukprot:Gregarina_sp_Poly_1__10339@NODE_734_length_6557_cov_123_557627_g549_i0_p2_GENE_NODE_734_length_6557_cov_123_557627_g549_i0NODE_734_length_6557_cov_123_557627_g549_i0_p2_ORF_typecomplete_len294_score60_04MCM_lid/PF17855_1/3_5e21MCM_lid/PF17855_1/2_1e03DUF3987/PF13148_6/0_13DUF3987/PF13148_6/1_3e02IZUMO/PF15005_6/0_086HAUSaugmin3/PF14932_6/90HAUSaugmin3/PF14932_6/0_19Spy1/PF11357_8/6_4e02Spy1/PF11357_8/0_96MqsA_antitoxin/PF15731_5/0_7MqsA_antitoxin/PF15731_5/4_3e02V_ATPase_I/PF01496_19/2_4_NODE_73